VQERDKGKRRGGGEQSMKIRKYSFPAELEFYFPVEKCKAEKC
jgi:hypothetical protein